MAQGPVSVTIEPSAQQIILPILAERHIHSNSFFRNYIPQNLLGVNSRIGDIRKMHPGTREMLGYLDGYPASILGVWNPSEDEMQDERFDERNFHGIMEDGQWYRPFTLHPAATEIAYLLKCRDQPDTTFWKVAEEEWKKQAEAIQKIVDAKETKVTSLISEIYQLVGLAAAFQGLLITATAQLSTSSHSCHRGLWWFIALSAFATIVTATGVKYKVGLVGVFQKSLDNERPLLHERKRLLRKLTVTDGPGFNLKPGHIPYKAEHSKFKTFLKRRIHPKLDYSSFILMCLIVFGVICGFALAFICK